MDVSNQNLPKKAIKRAARRLGVIDIDQISQAFLCVLKRESIRLLDESYEGPLPEESSKKLVNYLKLLKQFQEQELAALEALTDEELTARARVNNPKGEN